MNQLGLFLISTIIFFTSASAYGEPIEFPQEQLARESVLPVFDKVEVVKERRVKTAERFEVGGGLGISLTEALYDNKNFNLNFTYNFTNIHALNIAGLFMNQGLSSMGKDLAEGKGLLLNQTFDASLAPVLENIYAINYQVTMYYGKISLSKKTVINLSLHGLIGVINAAFSDTSKVGGNFGFGQKFYFTDRLGMRMDLTLMTYAGPDPTSMPSNNSEPLGSSDLEETTYFTTLFNFGLMYIL